MSATSPKAVPSSVVGGGGGDEVYVHRLVQDENAKTILLNVPIEAAEIMALKPPRSIFGAKSSIILNLFPES